MKNSAQSNSIQEKKDPAVKKIHCKVICLPILLICSVTTLVSAILLMHFNLFDLIMDERIKMREGLPAMENWRKPDLKILVKTYIFAVENSVEFERGKDDKLKLVEIGPIVYEQTITQEDIKFEEDSSLSYTTVRKFRFVEEASEPGIMNKSIIIVNPLLLPIASSVSGNVLTSMIISIDDVFLNRTVYQVLWECSSKLLDVSKQFFPILLPTSNCGILYNAFAPRRERYNVKIGTKNGFENFWKINTINGNDKIGYYTEYDYPECPSLSVVNATDGTGFPPYFNQNKITIATARIPRTFDLDFDSVVQKGRLTADKFIFSRNNLIRANDSTRDCVSQCGAFDLPDGLIDASMLAYNFPIALSTPHFYGFSGDWDNYLEGLSPNHENHSSYLLLEPKTGIPLEGMGSIQINIAVPQIFYITKLKKFSNKIIPTFWIQQALMNNGKEFEIHILVNVLPIVQTILIVLLFVASLLFYVKIIVMFKNYSKVYFVPTTLRKQEISFSSYSSDKKDLHSIVVV